MKPLRPIFEPLEDRMMRHRRAAGRDLVVGRTLATPSTAATSTPSPSYFVGEVQNNQVTITYTVYNEQADTDTGGLAHCRCLRRHDRLEATRSERPEAGVELGTN